MFDPMFDRMLARGCRIVALVALSAGVACGRIGYEPLSDEDAAVCEGGTCACVASNELCDGDDDDCDLALDDGCPSGVTLGAATLGATFGGPGGFDFSRPCGAGEALVGFDGLADESGDDATVHELTPICASLDIESTPGVPESSFGVVTSGARSLASVGGNTPDGPVGTTPFSERCPGDDVVIGIAGRAGDVPADTISFEVERFGFVCGALAVARSGGPSGPFELTVTRTVDSPQHGGGVTTPFEAVCLPGEVMTGVDGRGNWRLDAVRARCSPVSLSTL